MAVETLSSLFFSMQCWEHRLITISGSHVPFGHPTANENDAWRSGFPGLICEEPGSVSHERGVREIVCVCVCVVQTLADLTGIDTSQAGAVTLIIYSGSWDGAVCQQNSSRTQRVIPKSGHCCHSGTLSSCSSHWQHTEESMSC